MASQSVPMDTGPNVPTPDEVAQAQHNADTVARIAKIAQEAAKEATEKALASVGIRAPGAPPVIVAPPAVGQIPAPVHTPKPARFPLAQPKKFKGNQGDDVRAWLREYEMYCLLAEVPQNKWAIFATTYLGGT